MLFKNPGDNLKHPPMNGLSHHEKHAQVGSDPYVVLLSFPPHILTLVESNLNELQGCILAECQQESQGCKTALSIALSAQPHISVVPCVCHSCLAVAFSQAVMCGWTHNNGTLSSPSSWGYPWAAACGQELLPLLLTGFIT